MHSQDPKLRQPGTRNAASRLDRIGVLDDVLVYHTIGTSHHAGTDPIRAPSKHDKNYCSPSKHDKNYATYFLGLVVMRLPPPRLRCSTTCPVMLLALFNASPQIRLGRVYHEGTTY
jgi:hypothetical protein